MTNDVQPLTWQKRTNIEEHQQFFAKINEIVGQLSGTVERSETALDQATVALTDAAAAVATANAASTQAQTAAATVAGYDTRLYAVEVKADTNAANISHLDIETQDLYDRDAQSVKLAADHVQTVTGGLNLQGTNRTSDTAVGTDDTQIANGHRIVQELNAYGSTVDAKLNAYSQMVRTTGSQIIDGVKNHITPVVSKFYAPTITADGWYRIYEFVASESPLVSVVKVSDRNNGTFGVLKLTTRSSDSISIVKMYGDLEARNFRLALTSDRSKAYLYHHGARVSATLEYCNYAWEGASMCNTTDITVGQTNVTYEEPTTDTGFQSVVTFS